MLLSAGEGRTARRERVRGWTPSSLPPRGRVDTRAVVHSHCNPPLTDDPDRAHRRRLRCLRAPDAFDGCDAVVHAALGNNDVSSVGRACVRGGAGRRRPAARLHQQRVGARPIAGAGHRRIEPAARAPHFRLQQRESSRRTEAPPVAPRGTVELVILRPTIVFGPGSRWVFDFADALRAGTACLVDGARGVCNSIYVDNLGYAVLLAMKTPGIDGQVFLITIAKPCPGATCFSPSLPDSATTSTRFRTSAPR